MMRFRPRAGMCNVPIADMAGSSFRMMLNQQVKRLPRLPEQTQLTRKRVKNPPRPKRPPVSLSYPICNRTRVFPKTMKSQSLLQPRPWLPRPLRPRP